MQQFPYLKKCKTFFSTFLSKNNGNRSFILLSIFLLVVLLVSFIIPQLNFGRFYGSDGYTHLQATEIMASSRSLHEFYESVADMSADPSDESTGMNYPFGLWLFGATIAKISGLPSITAGFLFSTFFLLILVGSFYVYSSTWLVSREQKIFAVLFMLSMPQISLILMNYVPSIFILPFLFITLYFIFKEPVNWKLLPIAWLSIFIIIVSHTGTFLFLFSFSMAFFLLYCLFWGKFSKPLYITILSTLFIYVISLTWFPPIATQYKFTSMKLLLPGNFIRDTFNFPLPGELVRVFYQNMLVEHQFVYVVILAALLFTLAYVIIYIHRKIALFFSHSENLPALILPIQNLSHTTEAVPIWLGPFQIIFSVIGFFHLDNKGKCFLFTALLTTILPDLLQVSQGITVGSGALRQISYLVIIIPITATLGFWHILDYLNDPQSKIKKRISLIFLIVVCLMMIITPTLASTYYNPTLSGEDYIIGGLQWMAEKADYSEKVVSIQLRPLRVYSNMTGGGSGVSPGTESVNYRRLLSNIYFSKGEQNVKDIRKKFGVKYILSSDRMLGYFGRTTKNLLIDSNPALSKIYASNDFGIYEISGISKKQVPDSYLAEGISLNYLGGTYEIESDYYKVTLGANTPILKRFGPPENDYINYGYLKDEFDITGTELPNGFDRFKPQELEFTNNIKDNQITYMTVLKNSENQAPVGTLFIRYTFYPEVIKREYVLSNDWLVARSSPQMNVRYSIQSFSLLKGFILQNEQDRLERNTVVYEDPVNKNFNIEDFYLYNGDDGIYIHFAGISPQPSSISYRGSQNNRSAITITQSSPVKPGASFLSTQFISFGSENVTKKNIQRRAGIELIPYPDGINPILLSGYPNPQSDRFINNKTTTGYAILTNNSIPYAEVINPSIPLLTMLKNDITIIGSQKTGEKYFDDYTTQKTNMMVLMNYTNNQSASSIGFMPEAFNYNLDTLSILSSNKIPFIFSSQVNPTMNLEYAKGYLTPQMAYLNSEYTGVVLFPVASPTSTSLSSQTSSDTIFSRWRATIDSAANYDEMVLLLLQSQDIGDPQYTESFVQLFSYARERGLTFTTPARIANHFVQLQNISYSGFIDGDMAALQVTNTNHMIVKNVTFKVTLPELKNGNYRVNNGDIVRIKSGNNQSILYFRTDIPADSTKNITIEPDIQRKSLQIGIPQFPIEGTIEITVKDDEGIPLLNTDVLVDATYYQTDENGMVHVDLMRGYHWVTIQSPGYEKYSSVLNVKGRIYLIPESIGKII